MDIGFNGISFLRIPYRCCGHSIILILRKQGQDHSGWYKQFQGIQSNWIMSQSSRLLSLDRPSRSASKLDQNPSSSLR
uniref:Uncharacterized protein n=1 Tax=Nelumbo nucifera TaxID=4432 RepID=A0A822ZMW5_NELNU|nr:TPA_asm: hypothetical protein HUJ06_002526 [Nelumbo nucifera]